MPQTIDDLDVDGRRVLLRGDLNVPMRDGVVADATRIYRLVPTIRELLNRGAVVILASHLDRPGGIPDPSLSLKPLVAALSRALGGIEVRFAADCVGPEAETAVRETGSGGIVLLENLRFHAGEEANDPHFARRLAALADRYVNDAFSAAHRAHASTEAVAHLLPAAAGRLMEGELEALESVLQNRERPSGAIVGGSKISTKLELLENFASQLDMLVIGGAMANTFLHALGIDVGLSLVERGMSETANRILVSAEEAGCEIVLPSDVVVAASLADANTAETVPLAAVPGDRMILDVGPDSARALAVRLKGLRTLVWNGPLGAFETPPFDKATITVARAAAELTSAGRLKTVAGGGDTVSALSRAGVIESFSYVSTAGGAFIEWMEGRQLPGILALG